MSEFGLYPDGDEEVTRGLRALYAAPSGYGYWNELESRIMARVASVELAWWDEFDRWVRPALVLAALLIIAAAIAMNRAQKEATDSAYSAILAPPPVPGPENIRPTLMLDRDATLRYILAPRPDTSRNH
ncbi:MAG TPA: hypothetical protein VMH39_15950 [Gemmatimonadaceae bacterium]|nr:hypothetical protein [Gemmatimonadaceae bacterium]